MPSAFPMLDGPTRKPADGKPARRLIVLLHGLGADGDDLIGLAPYWAKLVPDAEFVSPHGLFPCDMAPYGRQWFSLRNRAPETMLAGIRASAPFLDAYLDEALAARGLDDGDMALVGFSQGTMMALHVGLRRAVPVAGIVGYSGLVVGPEHLAEEIRSRPPVLLVHGDADQVVPVEALASAASTLEAVEVPVEQLLRPGLGHGIDDEGLEAGGALLRAVFAED